MDGRAVEATIKWMKEEYNLDFIDTITEPGMDAYELNMTDEERSWLKRKLEISIKNHGSRIISVVGHDDCAGNPVNSEEHRKCIVGDIEATEALVNEIDPLLSVEIVGLWCHTTEDPKVWVVEKV